MNVQICCKEEQRKENELYAKYEKRDKKNYKEGYKNKRSVTKKREL